MDSLDNKEASALFSHEEIVKRIRDISPRVVPNSVHQAMCDQHAHLELSDKQRRNLQLVADANTSFVLTGQQIGLFLGPLFTLYKALAAVVTADEISKLGGSPCVPVFWLQTEDQDFEEIQSTQLITREYKSQLLSLPADIHRERSSVEHTHLDDRTEELLATLEDTYAYIPAAAETIQCVRSAYTPGRKLSDAFRHTLHQLLKETGILFFNPRALDDTTVSGEFFKKQLLEQEEIQGLLEKSGKRIAEKGGEEQVYIRPGSPLFFFHPEGEEGPRYRIEREGGETWKYVGHSGTVSTAELLHAAGTTPLQFSTTALSRPILQSIYFPTVAYIGGDAEMRYYQQIDELFSHFSLPEPLVIPRPHFTLIEPKIASWLDSLELTVEEAMLPEEQMLKLLAERLDENAPSPQELQQLTREGILDALEPMRAAFEQTEETILRSFEKNRDKMLSGISPLIARYTKALANNDATRTQRLEKVRSSLLPNGIPQEREYAGVSFLCKYGMSITEQISQRIVPFRRIDEVIQL